MKKRILSLALCLVMLFSLFPAFDMNAAAAGTATVVDTKSVEKNMLHLDKRLSLNDDGTYSIKLESYAKGISKTTQVTEAIPTDFVLILDQSGSMYQQDIPAGYKVAGNRWHPNDFLSVTVNNSGSRGNSISVDTHTYYYNVPGTNEYYEVYYKDYPSTAFSQIVDKDYWFSPDPIKALDCTTYESLIDIGGYTYENGNCDTGYSGKMEPMYYKASDGCYYRVYSYSEGLALRYHLTLFYYDSFGVRHNLGTYTYTWASALNNTVSVPLYTNAPYTSKNNQSYISHGYKPYYTDENGVEHQLPGSLSVDGEGDVFYNGVLYEKNSNVTRVSALETAVADFVDQVNEQATENNVNHKVAVIGFSDHYGDNDNTELLSTGSLTTRSAYNYNNDYQLFPYGYNYNGPEHNGSSTVGGAGGISAANYQAALQDATTAEGVATLKQAAHAVTACGGTEPEYGFYMAENVLKNRMEKTYTDAAGQTQKRNTVVVFFTDGHPGMYDSSDQIAAANKVVTAANRLKTNAEFNYTKVYSVGMFADGDDQPLTFTADYADRNNYLYQSGGYYFYRGNETATTNHNDTIKDYMECVSSKYPSAANFLNHSGTSDTGTSATARGTANTDSKTYYMKVTDTEGLKRAFENALIDVDTQSTEVTASTNSEFQDVINTADFEIPSTATATAYSVSFSTTDGVNYAEGTQHLDDYGNVPITNGKVTVNGFDYSTYYTSVGHNGRKLIVEIAGLLPKHEGELSSNTSTTIKPDVEDNPDLVALSLADSPKNTVGTKTYVVDYNAKMQLATGAKQMLNPVEENGKFVKSGENVTYQLDTGKQAGELEYDENGKGTYSATINQPYSSADTAMIFGKFYTTTWANGEAVTTPDTAVSWKKIDVVPAGSVYYDDDLTNASAVNVGDGSGYNAQISASPAEGNAEKGIYTFTFYGTGIDVYCTTDTTGGYVSAKLTQNGKAVAGQPNQTIRNYDKEVTRYNVPSISFTGLPIGEYTLTLQVLGSSNYKLDGIRVYNPADPSAYEGQDTHEQYAAYINMREALVNDNGVDKAFTDEMTEAVLGALFVDDSSKLTTEPRQQYDAQTHEPRVDENGDPIMGPAYASMYEAYKENSPKHEIYLSKNQAIIFQLSADAATAAANGNLWIGLSAPDQNKNTGTVTLKDAVGSEPAKTIGVTSGVDMYYPITSDMIGANGVVTIKNTGDNLISVTNLKITGNETIYNAVQAAQPANSEDAAPASLADAMPLVFEPLTMQAVKIAANNGVDPDAPADPGTVDPEDPGTPDQPDDPKPGWNDSAYNPMNILKTLFQSLLNGLGNLFKGLGGW